METKNDKNRDKRENMLELLYTQQMIPLDIKQYLWIKANK